MGEDAGDHARIGDGRHQAQAPAAVRARQHVEGKGAPQAVGADHVAGGARGDRQRSGDRAGSGSGGTVQRNPIWHDDITLFEDTEAKSQESGVPACTLGNAYQDAGRTAAARAAFERALQRRCSPRVRQTAYANLGTLASNGGDLDAAQRFYETAVQANPNSADTLFNLGNVIMYKGKKSPSAAQTALPYFARALGLNPYDPDIEAAVAEGLAILGQPDPAAQHARRAIELGARGQALNIAQSVLRKAGAGGSS